MMSPGILCLMVMGFAQPVGPSAEWKLDSLTLTNGSTLKGMILEESPVGVRFMWIRRQPGRATVTLTSLYHPREVAMMNRLSDADRAILREKVADLDAMRGGERERIDSLELMPTQWPGGRVGAKQYLSTQFSLTSDAPDEITRRVAVRLEQIYTAYERFLPPRHNRNRPTSIFLAADREGYRSLLGTSTGTILNPAVFDPNLNRIVCATELRPLGADLASARLRSAQQLEELEKYEHEIARLYKDSRTERDRYLSAAAEQRRKIWIAETVNGQRFDQETRQLFPLLYHETFHAYVGNFVYPPLSPEEVRAGKGTGELPRWLNEGLAQIFETAILDGTELRVGHAERDRLNRVQDGLKKKNGLTPLAELLRSGTDSFLTLHQSQKSGTNRVYLTSWALAFHLTFERKLIGGDAFHDYLIAVNRGDSPLKAFETLVGKPLPEYEREWRAYLARLQTDGSLKK